MPGKPLIFLICLIGAYALNNFNPAIATASKTEAKEDLRLEDRVIGSVFRAAAKAFLFTTDIEALKKSNIKKLNKMGEEKFRRKYVKIYPVIKEIPFLMSRYGVNENMTKDEAVNKIQPLQKKEIYEAIDNIPDAVIAGQFRGYLYRKKQEISKANLGGQINRAWNKIIRKID